MTRSSAARRLRDDVKPADANTPRDLEFDDAQRHRAKVDAAGRGGARNAAYREATEYVFMVMFDDDGDLKGLADRVEDVNCAEALSATCSRSSRTWRCETW